MIDYQAARTAMVDCQVRPSDVTLYPIIAAMLEVPRELFVPRALRGVAYAGSELELGGGRVELEPRVVAKMLDALNPDPEALVLDVAPGMGYTAALLARLCAAVVAVEEDADLAAAASEALAEAGCDTVLVENRPLAQGAPEHGPFDAIFVNGGVEFLPETLAGQLKPGGRIVAIFMQGALGRCRLGTKTGAGIAWRSVFDATAPVLSGFKKATEFVF
ncbi:MAG: protein-L-isoaspartate O-methyltransferase [Alphaproteobacteria bacterium]|nr:MAG: protein-L-isoaspartate O-methyltransferase [Alphaproteobacteria bacterium]